MFLEIINKFANLLIKGKKTKISRAIFILIFVLPVIILAIFSMYLTYNQYTEEAIQEKKSLAFLSSNIVNERLDGLINFGISLATRPRLIEAVKNDNWQGAITVLGNLLNNFQFIDRVVLYNKEAVIKADLPHATISVIGQNRRDRNWYKTLQTKQKPFVTEVYKRGAIPQINVIAVIIPIKTDAYYYDNSHNDKDRKNIIGILQIQLNLDIFEQWIKAADIGKGGLIYIVDQYGHIVYHPKFDSKKQLIDYSNIQIIQKLLKGAGGAEVNYNPVEQEERVAAYEPVPDYGWGIVVTQPKHLAYEKRNKQLIYLLVTYTIIILIALIIAYFLFQTLLQLNKSYNSLEKLSGELKRSNKELDDFAYIASHDLKEPLRSINNFSIYLIEDYKDKLDEEGVRKLNVLIDQSSRLEKFLNALLRYSRVGREKINYETVNLNDIIELVKQDLDFLLNTDNASRAQIINKNLPTIITDQVFIKEIFMNLISNGLKYNDKKEKIITVGFMEEYSSRKNVLYVRDNGIGIKDKHFEDIFKIFKRLHGRDKYGGGTGAGLTIVKKLVEALNGNIWVESNPDTGSTFYFTLSGGNI